MRLPRSEWKIGVENHVRPHRLVMEAHSGRINSVRLSIESDMTYRLLSRTYPVELPPTHVIQRMETDVPIVKQQRLSNQNQMLRVKRRRNIERPHKYHQLTDHRASAFQNGRPIPFAMADPSLLLWQTHPFCYSWIHYI